MNSGCGARNLRCAMTDPLARIADRLLLLRCQVGDGAAFADLVARHHARLGGYLRALLRNEAAADDALQDVWLAVWRGLPRLQDPDAFVPWALRIARDRAFRELRRRRAPTVAADDTLPAPRAGEFTDDDAAEVRAAIGTLPLAHRDVLLLRYVEGLSYDDIAAVAGVPTGTVRSRLFHAKRLLRGRLQLKET